MREMVYHRRISARGRCKQGNRKQDRCKQGNRKGCPYHTRGNMPVMLKLFHMPLSGIWSILLMDQGYQKGCSSRSPMDNCTHSHHSRSRCTRAVYPVILIPTLGSLRP